ncbi:MAG: T9SS type A sorting domain-containing protein [Bacteroidales bacterium]|nr:T9SS type A sorting domain-containing protein [Bacteroidales bacterium]
MKIHLSLVILLFAISATSLAQIYPPCGLDYGNSSDEANISYQMRYGTITDAVSAINQAKNTRGTALGCPQSEITYTMPSTAEPELQQIINVWNTIASQISSFTINCPRIGRYENNMALGAYYAMQAGYFDDYEVLSDIAEIMYAQQYAEWNVANPNSRNEGVFAYVHVPDTDPCYPGGVVGESVELVCDNLPQYCVEYTNGLFSGESFLTSAQDDANNWFDGGLAYDHGWVGIQMIEAYLSQNDPDIKQKCFESAELAGQYAISEYCVKNHNYTAKLIWLLAQLYNLTGDEIYKNELNYKLDKNLIPGILWDENTDGIVDGTNPAIYFNQLTSIAVMPGRMWDGHNSLPWYHAMNSWALTEAYVAFRDRGDVARAAELKPYVIGMIDNLAHEILYNGVVTPDQLGVRDITYALQIAIWKIAIYENEEHQNWENAMWAMWNSGYFNSYSTHSVCVGLFLTIKTETNYIPLFERDATNISNQNAVKTKFEIYPNPTKDVIFINTEEDKFNIRIYKISGQTVFLSENTKTIDTSDFSPGLYFVFLKSEKQLTVKKLIIEQ